MDSGTLPVSVARSSSKPEGVAKLKFTGSDRFVRELRKRVDAYFENTGRRRRDCASMYFKTASILMWFFGAYFVLLFAASVWWVTVPLAMILGLSVAAIGFNIQHDGAHKAYSERPWVNKIMSLTLDMMGGSSYLWNWKHNQFHHTYTNIAGHDDDINIGIFGRLSPEQPRYWFHRLQGIYLWVLYGLLAIKWHFVDDFYQLARGRIGDHKIKRPRGKDLVVFIAGKALFFSMALVIPMLMHPFWTVLAVYAIAAFTSGVVLSIVFQLAHCVEEAEFPVPVTTTAGNEEVQNNWAIHQIQTTVNFSRRNPVLSWFLGGLNFQIEHHLFHKISHVHYPALSKVVEATCREFGIAYNAHRSFFSALASHFRWLVEMGKPVRPATAA